MGLDLVHEKIELRTSLNVFMKNNTPKNIHISDLSSVFFFFVGKIFFL